MPRFLLKVLTADTAKRWRRRFRATATMSAKRHGMVIAVSQRQMLLAASTHGRWFHTSLRCVAGSCWIQKSLGLATPVAMSVPTTRIRSHDSVFQPLTVIDRKTALIVLLRFWDGAVPFSGRMHSEEEWVNVDVHTNSVESVWSLLKRSVIGTYHKLSIKHLDELEHRFNNRGNKFLFRDTLLKLVKSEALPYQKLTEAA